MLFLVQSLDFRPKIKCKQRGVRRSVIPPCPFTPAVGASDCFVVENLGQWGISIKSMTEPFETDSSVGKFLVSMLASAAQLERDAIRDRSGAGMERLARQGKWLGGRPAFGYQVIDGKLALVLST
jgi:hypothetical protein